MKASNINYWPVQYKFHFVWLILFSIFFNSCKRGSNCNDSDRNDYFVIPASTKPLILNKRGETLVFSNLIGDTVSFYCSKDTQFNKLVYDEFYGSGDCAPKHRKYSETHEFYYFGDTSTFSSMKITYYEGPYTLNSTNYEVRISDSIYDGHLLLQLLNLPIGDSIYFNGEKVYGSYLFYNRMSYNDSLGIIKFKDNNSTNWQLIHKQ